MEAGQCIGAIEKWASTIQGTGLVTEWEDDRQTVSCHLDIQPHGFFNIPPTSHSTFAVVSLSERDGGIPHQED